VRLRLTRGRFVRGCRALGALMLLAVVALFVGAALTPMPAALREGGGYGSSVRFVDRDGEVIREVRAEGDHTRAQWISLSDTGKNVQHAIIAAEDRRFEEHVGVDPLAILRASGSGIRARRVVSGASTLTMQLARTVAPHPRNLRGKLAEMAMAVRIEASLSKDEILEHYLNRVAFADGIRGVGAASRWFFDKPPSELSVAEAATLAALPRGPHYYSLVKRPEQVLARRDRILDRMKSAGFIDEDARARAKAEPLTLQKARGGFGAPHLTDLLLSQMPDRPARIETTLDRDLQKEIETATAETVHALEKRHVTAASVLVVDNHTGDVLAYVGSPRWEDDVHGGKNDGVRALRQPGSTLKPFVYGLAMEDLGWTPATLLPDVEMHLETPGGPYSPRNYDERFHGPVRLREALGNSYNVPAVYTANEVGIARVLGRLREVGLDTLDREADFYGPALALGDGEVRLWDLVGAYSAIARGGSHRALRAVKNAPIAPERRVMSAESAAMIADVLADNSARVAAFGEHSALELPFRVSAKTGTSKGYRDNWTIGFTDDVTVGVWVGNFDGSAMREVSGITGAAPLFRTAMTAAMRAHEDLHDRALPSTLTHVKVCALSGGAPHAGCKHVVDEIVPKDHPSPEPCTMHVTVAGKTYERFDGPFAAWATATGRETVTAPARLPFAATDAALRIRYPRDGARFVLDPDRPRSAQAIPLKIDASSAAEVKVYVDGRLAAKTRSGESPYWTLERGAHAIVAESGATRSSPINIRVD
jgi:penicillin-binding protein 1C